MKTAGTTKEKEAIEIPIIKLLVADDQALFRIGLAELLDNDPRLEVVGQVSDGLQAVEKALELEPDIVLMDIRMPGIDGVEATRRLLLGARPPTVVLLSTYDTDAGRQFVAESGATAYVNKGVFSPDRLELAR